MTMTVEDVVRVLGDGAVFDELDTISPMAESVATPLLNEVMKISDQTEEDMVAIAKDGEAWHQLDNERQLNVMGRYLKMYNDKDIEAVEKLDALQPDAPQMRMCICGRVGRRVCMPVI